MEIKTCADCPHFEKWDDPIETNISRRRLYVGACYKNSKDPLDFIMIEMENLSPETFVCEFPGEQDGRACE